jgi:hypothetical protein
MIRIIEKSNPPDTDKSLSGSNETSGGVMYYRSCTGGVIRLSSDVERNDSQKVVCAIFSISQIEKIGMGYTKWNRVEK